MDNVPNVRPWKITQPFQLLAVWMVGFMVVTGQFIYASLQVQNNLWQCIAFSGAAIIFAPLFMMIIFKLQTKYRPEMQGGEHYQEILKWREEAKRGKLRDL